MSLYLNQAFGFESTDYVKAVTAQQRGHRASPSNDCPRVHLMHNEALSSLGNNLKFWSYFPVINIAVGIVVLCNSNAAQDKSSHPNNVGWWIARGVAIITVGPLLAIVDIIKTIFNNQKASAYIQAHPKQIAEFNTNHRHSHPYAPWPGHPIDCISHTGQILATNY